MVRKLSHDKFLRTFGLVPRLAVNILVTNQKSEFLLTQRAIPPRIGAWHFPGSFLLKGESLFECLQRVAKNEIGLAINKEKYKLLGVFEDIDKDPRGHVVDIIYGYNVGSNTKFTPGKDTKEVKFFKKIPAKTGFTHSEVLRKLGYVSL